MKQGVDYTGVAVVFYCHDGKGNFVMAKRGKNSRDEIGNWEIGGGGLDFGATVEETLRKEIKEEYDTEVLSYEYLGYRDIHRTHAGRQTHWIGLDFKVLINPSEVKNAEPHKLDEVRFFRLDSLPSPLHSQVPHFLKIYKEKLG